MFGQNGNKAAGSVPIIGLPCTVKALSLTAILVCNCERKSLLLLQGPTGVTATCPACRRIFIVAGVTWRAGQQPELNIQIGADTDEATGPHAAASAP